jgi:soluble lytic murein transglycosylase-like protein
VSPNGAQGLMQLMPQTATLLGVENSLDAAANVDGGTRYLRNLLVQYNQDLTKALAAYNAGPARVQQFHGVPPYPETIAYINRVVGDLNHRKLVKSAFAFQLARKKVNDQTFKP